MVTDIERRRLNLAKEAFIKLASGGKFTRKELFTDPNTNQHLNEEYWEFRFLNYLIEVGIIGTNGNRQNKRYYLLNDATGEPRDLLQHLLSNDSCLMDFVRSGTVIIKSNLPIPESVNSDQETPEESFNPLEIIATRLMENIELLAAIHAQNAEMKQQLVNFEKRLIEVEKNSYSANERVGKAIKLKLLMGGE